MVKIKPIIFQEKLNGLNGLFLPMNGLMERLKTWKYKSLIDLMIWIMEKRLRILERKKNNHSKIQKKATEIIRTV